MRRNSIYIILLVSLTLLVSISVSAQSVLERSISIQVSRQRLDNVLEILSNKGNFFFSYNSNIIQADSLVTLSVINRPVRDVLLMLFGEGYEFRESGNYIILRRAPIKLRLVTNQAVSDDKFYTVSGYVIDDQTGEKVSDASIYEKQRLAYASTNSQGYFKIKLKGK
ncbi:MAG TPA: STN and carboxypeptidase regulatory-like domain-containing protein, partial [Flavitalea sp.]|nr:STN and carboxypeptidase regulatory-like domain-containing protein [Flavitalea sp.]